jgi:hypothetical protein
MLKISQIIGGIILGLAGLFSTILGQTENPVQTVDLDVAGFIQESLLKTNQANFRLISDYTYKMRRTINSQDGKTTSTLFESYFPSRLKKQGENRGVIIVLEENGKALPAKKIEKQRREAAKNLEKSGKAPEKKSTSLEQRRDKGLPLDWTYNVAVGLTTILEVCRFYSPLQDTIEGRESISLSFDRCNVNNLPVNKSYLANVRGKIWFDAADKAPVRLEARQKSHPKSGTAQFSPKVSIIFTQKRVSEGLWLPALIRVEGIGNEAVFPNLKINWQIEFFDYKLPETQIEDIKINGNNIIGTVSFIFNRRKNLN